MQEEDKLCPFTGTFILNAKDPPGEFRFRKCIRHQCVLWRNNDCVFAYLTELERVADFFEAVRDEDEDSDEEESNDAGVAGDFDQPQEVTAGQVLESLVTTGITTKEHIDHELANLQAAGLQLEDAQARFIQEVYAKQLLANDPRTMTWPTTPGANDPRMMTQNAPRP